MNIQNTQIRAPLDILDGSPPNTEMPVLDEKTLSWVYAVEGAFISQDFTAWRTAQISIDTANVSILDDGSGETITIDQGGNLAIADEGRYYQSIACILRNGTVTPIEMAVDLRVTNPAGGVQGYHQSVVSQASPTRIVYGPIYAPPQFVLEVRNITQGGLGDTLQVFAFALVHTRGNPVAMVPGARQVT